MKKNVKKGFTLVELLVVIAIIAILATVSVVGYLSFTKKANISNDVTMTTQMNTILQAEEATNKSEWPSEANDLLKESGIDLSKLEAYTDGYKYVWDKATNRILLLDETNNVVAPEGVTDASKEDTFIVVHNQSEIDNLNGDYAVLVAEDFKEDIAKVTSNTDVLDNSVEIMLEGNKENVSLNTIGGKVTINTPTATVKHYGSASLVDIIEVSPNSYHLYGDVTTINIEKGKIEIEAKSNVKLINVEENGVIININQNANVTTVSALEGISVGGNANVEKAVNVNSVEEFLSALNDETIEVIMVEPNTYSFEKQITINRSIKIIGSSNSDVIFKDNVSTITNLGMYRERPLIFSNSQNVDILISGISFSYDREELNNNDDKFYASCVVLETNGETTISGCSVSYYPRHGFVLYGGTAIVENNYFEYLNIPTEASGNAITIDAGCQAVVRNNEINGFISINENWSSVGLAIFNNGFANAYNNIFNNCNIGISISNIYGGDENKTDVNEENNIYNACAASMEYYYFAKENVILVNESNNCYYVDSDKKNNCIVWRYVENCFENESSAIAAATDKIDVIYVTNSQGLIIKTIKKPADGWN